MFQVIILSFVLLFTKVIWPVYWIVIMCEDCQLLLANRQIKCKPYDILGVQSETSNEYNKYFSGLNKMLPGVLKGIGYFFGILRV